MKATRLVMIFASLSLLSSLAHADIVVSAKGGDVCSQLPGTWNGEGHVSALSGLVNCAYHGVGHVTEDASNLGNYNLHVELQTDSFGCPAENLDLAGTCLNGTIVLHRDDADLSGSMDADGRTANITGEVRISVTIPVIGKETLTAKVNDLKLTKQ